MNENTADFINQFKLAVAAYDNRLMRLSDQNRSTPAKEVTEEYLQGHGLPLERLTRALETYQRSSHADQEALLVALVHDHQKASGS